MKTEKEALKQPEEIKQWGSCNNVFIKGILKIEKKKLKILSEKRKKQLKINTIYKLPTKSKVSNVQPKIKKLKNIVKKKTYQAIKSNTFRNDQLATNTQKI